MRIIIAFTLEVAVRIKQIMHRKDAGQHLNTQATLPLSDNYCDYYLGIIFSSLQIVSSSASTERKSDLRLRMQSK